jgi:uncharacterized protein involved in tellurium resistance
MSIGDPATAPQRADLPFLRHRRRPPAPPAAAAAPATAAAPAAPTGPKVDYVRHTQPPSPSLDLSSSLDLSDPPAAAPAPTAPAAPADSSALLDLSDAPAAAPTPTAPAAPARPRGTPAHVHRDVRIGAGQEYLLAVKTPTVSLTRTQSGIGHLDIEAVCSAEVGDLRIGAVYQLHSGGSSTVQHAGGHRFAPPNSRRPVLLAAQEEYERITLDLRQIRDVERITVYAFSESRRPLKWGGTLVVTTFGGARIELPLDTLYEGPLAVLLSLYNFDGELVIRAEMENIAGDVREAARAYGYDRITWRDDRAPAD